jgi:GAF domain-containing protein
MSDDWVGRALQDLFSEDIPEGEPSGGQGEETPSPEVDAQELESLAPQGPEAPDVPTAPVCAELLTGPTDETAPGAVPGAGQQVKPQVSPRRGAQELEVTATLAGKLAPAGGATEYVAQAEGDAWERKGAPTVRVWWLVGMAYAVANTLFFLILAYSIYRGWPEGAPAVMEKLGRMAGVSAVFAVLAGVLVAVQWWLAQRQQRTMRSMGEQSLALHQRQASVDARCRELEEARAILQDQVRRLDLCVEAAGLASPGLGLQEYAARIAAWFCDRLAVCCAGLFLLDDDGATVTLEAAAGHIDEVELGGQTRLDSDEWAMLQACVANGEPCLSRDALSEQGSGVCLSPHARSALMLPLISLGELIGAIRLESTDPLAFEEQDATYWQSLADQVAPQIASARQRQDLQARLHQLEALQKTYVRDVWEQFLRTRPQAVYEYEQPGASPLPERPGLDLDRFPAGPHLMALGQPDAGDPLLVSPIALRDQVVGMLGLENTQGRSWTEDEIDIVSAVSEQIGLRLDNARLFEEAQAGASREHQVREITARMRESLDIDAVLKTAAQEIRQLLGLHDVTIALNPAPRPLEGGTSRRGQVGQSYYCDAQGVIPAVEGSGSDGRQDLVEQQIPIVVRGQAVGAIRARKSFEMGEWAEDELALLETLVEQLNVALENARLYEDLQRRAVRDRLIGDLAARMGETLDVEVVLRTAVQELREALDLPEVTVRLVPPTTDVNAGDRPFVDAPSTGRR